jgi:hypothetical protein
LSIGTRQDGTRVLLFRYSEYYFPIVSLDIKRRASSTTVSKASVGVFHQGRCER